MKRKARSKTFQPGFALDRNLKDELPPESWPLIDSSQAIAEVFQEISKLEREVLVAGAVDCKHRLLHCSLAAAGSADHLLVRVGDVFTGAVRSGGTAVFLVHNHPSGSLAASRVDMKLTRDVAAAGLMLGFPLLDHVVLSTQGFCSLLSPELIEQIGGKVLGVDVVEAAEVMRGEAAWYCHSCAAAQQARLPELLALARGICIPARCNDCGAEAWLKRCEQPRDLTATALSSNVALAAEKDESGVTASGQRRK